MSGLSACHSLLVALRASLSLLYSLAKTPQAFSVVVLACMRRLDIPHNKVNVLGGACALGHPIGLVCHRS